jgi:undecaprenyl-diphosphatase
MLVSRTASSPALQGLSAVPGLSRSGLVACALLLRGLDKKAALRLTFIISVPVIYGVALADLAFGFGLFRSSVNEVGLENMLAASIAAFVVSLCCLRGLLKMAARLNFSRFLLGFGGLTLGLTLLSALLR